MREYRIPNLAYKYVNYDMIHTYTELPPLSDPRLRLLSAVLGESKYEAEGELFTLVTSLVQLGMDTHDQIESHSSGQSELQMRSTQLKVLAGDYFSTRFYQLLAQQGQISMIASLSEAVCDVNRLKMDFYTKQQQASMTTDEYFSYRVKIKSQMFMLFGELMQGETARLWPELLLGISRCETYLEELQSIQKPETCKTSWAYWLFKQTFSKQVEFEQAVAEDQLAAWISHNGILPQLKQRVDHAYQQIQEIIEKLESEKLAATIKSIADELYYHSLQFTPELNETR